MLGLLPRLCHDCGASYQPAGPRQKRCNRCREGRAHRPAAQGERASEREFLPVDALIAALEAEDAAESLLLSHG